MCIPLWVKYGTTGENSVVFHNLAVSMLNGIKCGHGGSANLATYGVLMIDYHTHLKQVFWLMNMGDASIGSFISSICSGV